MEYAQRMTGFNGDLYIKAGIEYGPAGAAVDSSAGATSSGANITVNSTASLVPGMAVSVIAGVGVFGPGTTVKSITSPTVFVASAAPLTALSGGASVVRATPVLIPEWIVCGSGCVISKLEEYIDGVSTDVMGQHGFNPGDTIPDGYTFKSSRSAGFSKFKITTADANGYVISPGRNRNFTNSVNSGILTRG